MKKYISFSGGVESSTLCLLFGGSANAIFADTGFEHQLIYDRIEKMQQFIRDFHKNKFEIIRITSKHGTLPEYIQKQKFYPSFHTRFCTRMFKIEPIDEYLKQYADEGVELMIGLNKDEENSRTGNHGNLPFVKYSYPLIDNNLTRKACEDILSKAGIYPNFPAYMKRGGCVGCFYKSKKEFEAMVHLSPDEFDKVVELEENIQDERKEFYAIKKDMGSMRKFRDKVKSQPLLLTPQEIYQDSNQTKCGVFCNR